MLQFDEATHTYTVEGVRLTSVSEVVASQFKKFDKEGKAAQMHARDRNDPNAQYYGMTVAEIIALWDGTGNDSRNAGLALHKAIEIFLLKGTTPDENYRKTMEWIQFENFMYDHKDWECVACEKRRFKISKKRRRGHYGYAGTIDAIFKTPDGYVIVDWKRAKKIEYDGYGTGQDMMRHVPDSNYYKYSLQLSCYAHLLGKICELYIVQFHPTIEDYQIHRAHNFHVEAGKLLE